MIRLDDAGDPIFTFGPIRSVVMKRLSCLAGAVLLTALLGRGTPSSETETFRLVHVHVLLPNGQPAAQRIIYLRGWVDHRYGCLGPTNDDQNTCGWRYTTDDQGNVTVRLGDFAATLSSDDPDWGTYAILVDPTPEDAGAISTRFWIGAPLTEIGEKEWGKAVAVPPSGLDLTVRIQRGTTISGRIVDADHHDRPLSGVQVSAMNDLIIGTRTGYPGYVFAGSTTTDNEGRFNLPHRFPTNLWLTVHPARMMQGDNNKAALWTQTKITGEWRPAESHFLSLPKDSTLKLEMGAIPNPAFHYRGRVVDAEGRPVPGAEVVLGLWDNPQKADSFWCDRAAATAQADGTFDLLAWSPWGAALTANDPNQPQIFGQVLSPEFNRPGWYSIVVTRNGQPTRVGGVSHQ